MSVTAQQIKEHSIVFDSQGKEFAKVESLNNAYHHPPTRTHSTSMLSPPAPHSPPPLAACVPSRALVSCSHMQGADMIKLTKDSTGGDSHHFIPLAWVNKVEGNQVRITKTAEEAKQQWKTEAQ